MSEYHLKGQNRDIIYNGIIPMLVIVPTNILMLFIFPLINPFLEGFIYGIISPLIPTTFDLALLIIFLMTTILLVFFTAYGITIGIIIAGFVVSRIIYKRVNIEVKRTDTQNWVQRLKGFALVPVIMFFLWLLYYYSIIPIPASFFKLFQSSPDIALIIIQTAFESFVGVTLFIVMLVGIDGGLSIAIDYIYLYYRKAEKYELKEVPKIEWISEKIE